METQQKHRLYVHQYNPKKKSPNPPPDTDQNDKAKLQFDFLKLPLEVRRMIYRYSLDYAQTVTWPSAPRRTSDLVKYGHVIFGHIEGGGHHQDAPHHPSPLHLSTKCAPNVSLLRANRQIYAEALEESYRYILLRIRNLSSCDIESGRMKYWLRKHPFRGTRHVVFDRSELPDWCVSAMTAPASRRTQNMVFLDLDRSSIALLIGLLNGMHKLKAVTFRLGVHVSMWNILSQLHNFIRWVRQTGLVAVSLRKDITVKIEVKLDDCRHQELPRFVRHAVSILAMCKKTDIMFDLVESDYHAPTARWRSGTIRLERRTGLKTPTDAIEGSD